MKKIEMKNAQFVRSGARDNPPVRNEFGAILPEVAVAGRSNVGKSTLLNHLFGSKNLVKTSSTPGKTQLINYFSVNDELCFVDLPGYGYAKVPEKVRKKWGPMIQGYLEDREQLKLILLLFDIRRKPNQDDHQMLEWILHQQIPLLLVLTKVDKVKLGEKKKNTKAILEAFSVPNLPHVWYSAPKNIGKKELIFAIEDYFKGDSCLS